MHAKNWVAIERGWHTAVIFIPAELGLTFNAYLRCPVENRQARKYGVLVMPS